MVNSIRNFVNGRVFIGTNSPMKLRVDKTPTNNKFTLTMTPCRREEANIIPNNRYINLSSLEDSIDIFTETNSKGSTIPRIRISKSKDKISVSLNKNPGTLIYDKLRLSSAPKAGNFDGNIVIGSRIKRTTTLYQVCVSNDEKKETLYAVLTPIKRDEKPNFPSYNEGRAAFGNSFINCHYKNFAFTGTITNAITTLMGLSKIRSIKDMISFEDNGIITLAFKQSCDFCNEEFISTEHFEKESEQSEICENCNENIDTIEELLDTIKMLIDNQENMEAKINLLEQKLAEQKADNAKLQKIAKILADT